MKYICILQQDDGKILVSQSDQAPADFDAANAQEVKTVEDACTIVEQAMGQPDEDDGMKAAQSGYDRTASKRMMGGGSENPASAIFGE